MKIIISTLVFTLLSTTALAQVSLSEFQNIIQAFHAEYDQELQTQNSVLYINRPPAPTMPNYWWEQEYTHASYSTYTSSGVREHNLFIFGGFGRMQGMTRDALVTTVCHELGHGIGGAPLKLKSEPEPISAEGQSDYFATRYCLERMFKRLPPTQEVRPVSAYVAGVCSATDDPGFCLRAFQALEVERMLFKVGRNVDTSFEARDPEIVNEVNHDQTFYPSPQCRLDTMMAGVLKQERPRCWWAPEN